MVVFVGASVSGGVVEFVVLLWDRDYDQVAETCEYV